MNEILNLLSLAKTSTLLLENRIEQFGKECADSIGSVTKDKLRQAWNTVRKARAEIESLERILLAAAAANAEEPNDG